MVQWELVSDKVNSGKRPEETAQKQAASVLDNSAAAIYNVCFCVPSV